MTAKSVKGSSKFMIPETGTNKFDVNHLVASALSSKEDALNRVLCEGQMLDTATSTREGNCSVCIFDEFRASADSSHYVPGNAGAFLNMSGKETSMVIEPNGLMEEGWSDISVGPLSESNQHHAVKVKSYRKFCKSNSSHRDPGDSYKWHSFTERGQENHGLIRLRNQWTVKEAQRRHHKDVVIRDPEFSEAFPSRGPAESHCWVPVHKTNPSSSAYLSSCARVGLWKATNSAKYCVHLRRPVENSSAASTASHNQPDVVPHGSHYSNTDSATSTNVQKAGPRLTNPRAHSATYKPFDTSLCSKPVLGLNHGGHALRDCGSCQATAIKWVPVAAKTSKILQKVHPGITFTSHIKKKFSSNGTAKQDYAEEAFCPQATLIDCEISYVIPSKKEPCEESRPPNSEEIPVEKQNSSKKDEASFDQYVEKLKETDEFVGSRAVMEALTAAYKLQLLSGIIQFTIGYPLADFETFLNASCPAITASFVCEKFAVCSSNHQSSRCVCEHQIQDVSLSALWDWYENPGSYGLKVRIEARQDLNGFMDEKTPFDAHFVPSLSAVQLFGYPVHSNSEGNNEGAVSFEMKDKGDVEWHSSSPRSTLLMDSLDRCGMGHLSLDNENLSSVSSPSCSSNSELLFEFFESEQPYNRKPLHLKILELSDSGTPNLQVYGDPKKLVSLTLNEIHPASWFSVAWYPICRIPEGKLRASFLTYHSFGHSVKKKDITADLSPNKSTPLTSFPAIGLQSYNTQGECWFDIRRQKESSTGKQSLGDSEILNRRLQTLQLNASLLARGSVSKDNIKVDNVQPDYEFFVSRKR
ncbi:unnamed protein product [Linum tenue]|uniref:Uncharacterized protein n=1 Tax=Linum tenue TaxID=586396 RepID=A0AAV0QYY4_9ROSI|nr:unnamed protein product [Linum tenue]